MSSEELPGAAAVGMKPEKKASVLLVMMFWMGTQGLSKVDWTTEWFYALLVRKGAGFGGDGLRGRTLGWNWNWTMSPALALMLLGKKAMEPFGPPTWMVCVTRLPVEPVAADVDPDAVDVEFVVEVLVSEAAMDADDTED